MRRRVSRQIMIYGGEREEINIMRELGK